MSNNSRALKALAYTISPPRLKGILSFHLEMAKLPYLHLTIQTGFLSLDIEGVILTKKFTGFTAMFLVDAAILWFANQYMPGNYVLMTFFGSWWLALGTSAFLWTLIVWFTVPVADMLKIKLKKGMGMMVAYLVANFIAIWGVARVGLGFGVKSFVWVFALAFVANFVQFAVWMLLAKLKLADM